MKASVSLLTPAEPLLASLSALPQKHIDPNKRHEKLIIYSNSGSGQEKINKLDVLLDIRRLDLLQGNMQK